MPDDEVGVKVSVKDRARFSSEVNRAKKDLDDLGNAGATAARKAKDSAPGWGILTRSVGLLGAAVKVGIEAFAGIGVAAVVAGVKLFKMGNDAEQIKLRYQDVFGTMTGQVDTFIKTLNQKYGVPTADLQAATAQFGRLGQSAKIASDQLPKFSTDVVKAGLDLAAFYNKDPKMVFTALQSGLSGLTRPLRQYGIFIEQANIDARAMQMGLGNNAAQAHKASEAMQAHAIAVAKLTDAQKKHGANSEQVASAALRVEKTQDAINKAVAGGKVTLTDAQKVQIRQQLILEQLGVANGALAKRTDTAAGQLRIMRGRAIDLANTIGMAILPLGNTLLHLLNNGLAPAFKWLSDNAAPWAEKARKELERINTVIGDAVRAFHVGGWQGFVGVLDNATGAGGRLTDAAHHLYNIGHDLWIIFSQSLWPIIKDLAIAAGVTLYVAFNNLDRVTGFLANHTGLLSDFLKTLVVLIVANKVATVALYIAEGIGTAYRVAYIAATEGYAAAVVWATAADAANVVGAETMLGVLSAGLVRLGLSAGAWLWHAASVAIDTAGRYAWLGANIVAGLIAEGVQLTIEAAKWTAMGIAMAASTVAQGAATVATALWTAAQWALNAAMDANPVGLIIIAIALLIGGIILLYKHSATFRRITGEAFGYVWKIIMDVYHWVAANWPLVLGILTGPIGIAVLLITHNWDKIKDIIGGVVDWVRDRLRQFIKYHEELPGKIAGLAVGMWDGFKNAFKTAINWIIRAWDSLHFHIPGFSLGPVHMGDFDLGMPHIPELHAGGTTTSPGVVNMKPSEELVVLPAAASVIPLPREPSMVPQRQSTPADTGPKVIQLTVDRRVLAEVTLDGVGDDMARR